MSDSSALAGTIDDWSEGLEEDGSWDCPPLDGPFTGCREGASIDGRFECPIFAGAIADFIAARAMHSGE
jgi:hypothetical protein